MRTKKRLALALAAAMLLTAAACHDSSQGGTPSPGQTQGSQTGTPQGLSQVDYDPEAEIAPYLDHLPEIPEADKGFVIETTTATTWWARLSARTPGCMTRWAST